MEQSFSERLKKYRKEKNFTQQDLADALGVSNKTISRWESEGGYPDVPLLPPLAHALGVTVDDLLDEARPVRTLTRQDWQSMLSFVFAIGGGVLFFLLRLFVPVPVCYLGYLGCMAYGVYLQCYYCYQSRWFRWGNLVMSFFVNLNLAAELFAGGVSLITAMVGVEKLVERLPQLLMGGARVLTVSSALLALVLTALTAIVVERVGLGNKEAFRLTVGLRRPTLRCFIPTLGALALLGFWLCYYPAELPRKFYLYQRGFYYGLLAVLVLLCVALFRKKGYRWGLASTGMLAVGGYLLPTFAKEYAIMRDSNEILEATERLSDLYPRFFRPTPELVTACIGLAILCAAAALIRISRKGTGK